MSANAGRTLATLAGLALTLPVDALVVGVALVGHHLAGVASPRHRAPSRRRTGLTVLLNGAKMTKSLTLARAFHAAGHRVVMVESARYRLTGHRFSRAVDAFHCVPEATAPGYAEALLDVVRREGVDVFVPVSSPASSLPDARAGELLDGVCEVIHADADTVAMLDDKASFTAAAAALGLAVPDSHRITDARQIEDFDFPAGTSYILKRIAYNPVGRRDLTPLSRDTPERNRALARSLPISADDPWLLQEWLPGAEYCTHATVRDGRIQVWACCASSAFQVNYAQIDHREIEDWVTRFTAAHPLTGQVSFDFVDGADGRPRAIECNPRTHSAITMFADHPHLAAAYLDDDRPRCEPLPDSRPTYWIYHELWRLLTEPGRRRRLAIIAAGRDAIFDSRDPLPYLLVHHLQIPALLVGNLLARRGWTRIDFNIGKLVEKGGD